MKKVKKLLGLPFQLRVSVLVWMVQHAQPTIGGFQLFLRGLEEEKKSNYSTINAVKSLSSSESALKQEPIRHTPVHFVLLNGEHNETVF